MRRRAPIDWLGNVTFAVGLTLVMIGITYGIEPYGRDTMGWTNPTVVAELAIGVVLLVAFLYIETKVQNPMFRLPLFKIRAFTAGTLSSFLSALGRGGPHVHADHLAAGDLAPRARLLVLEHAALGGHLHAAAHGRFPHCGAGLGHTVGPLRLAPVRHRRHARGGVDLRAARTAAGRLLLPELRPHPAAERARHGRLRRPQPGGGHEQPASPSTAASAAA